MSHDGVKPEKPQIDHHQHSLIALGILAGGTGMVSTGLHFFSQWAHHQEERNLHIAAFGADVLFWVTIASEAIYAWLAYEVIAHKKQKHSKKSFVDFSKK